ncbi:hypothetical protein PENTCL1PPCAC_30334, partial [Pristionchus entomophagus]
EDASGASTTKDQQLSKEQLEEMMTDIELHSLELNDKWNVLSMKWWKSVLGAVEGKSSIQDIRPIDNSTIITTASDSTFSLAPNLIEKKDFITVPGTIFEALANSFGVENEQRDRIQRVVISDKRHGNILEIYPESFDVVFARDRSKKVSLYLRNDTVGSLREKALTAFRRRNLGLD